MNCKKFEFKGTFGVDGVCGGDTYPFWLVTKETFIKVLGYNPSNDDLQDGKYKMYVNQLLDYSNEGKKQNISIRITTD